MICRPIRMACATLALAAAVLTATPASAQLADNLSSYAQDNALLYLEPLKNAIGSGLSDGLFASGGVATGTVPRVRLTLSAMLISFSDEDRVFQPVAPAGFPGDVSGIEAPTVIGAETGPSVIDSGSGASFSFPGGLDIDRLPLAAPQLTVGLRGLEASLRYFSIDTGDDELGDISLFGLGGRYDISSLLGALPVQVSAMVYYQKLKFGEDLLEADAFSYGVQVSKRFVLVEPYAGFGFDSFGLDATYTDSGGTSIRAEYDTETNPHLTLGSAIHLGLVHLNGELNFSEQFSVAFGLGLGL